MSGTPTVGQSINFKEPKGLSNVSQRETWQRNLPRFLQQIGLLVQGEIIKKLTQANFKHQTGRIESSIKMISQPEKSRVIVWADPNVAGHAKYQEKGVQPHQMTYLANAIKAIPLVAGKGGGTIFRKATEKSMRDGKWMHPGYEGKFFFRDGVKAALKTLNQHVKSFVVRVVKGD